jgi:hypothetical protein
MNKLIKFSYFIFYKELIITKAFIFLYFYITKVYNILLKSFIK